MRYPRHFCALIPGLLLLATPARALWVQDGSTLNQQNNTSAEYARIEAANGQLWVCFNEKDGSGKKRVYVKTFNGTDWTAIGAPLNVDANKDARTSDLVLFNGTPYVVWKEDGSTPYGLYVYRYHGAAWEAVGTALNLDPTKSLSIPRIGISDSGLPVVGWHESDGSVNQTYVKRFNCAAWIQLGGSLNVNVNASASYIDVAMDVETPYIAWRENDGGIGQVYVKRFNGSSWQLLGGGSLNLNTSRAGSTPNITIAAGTPYLAWDEQDAVSSVRQIYVKRFNGTAWEQLGGTLNVNTAIAAFSPAIDVYNGTPYVAYQSDFGYVMRYTGTDWEWLPGILNDVDDVYVPDMLVVNGTPYVSYHETNVSLNDIYVKHYVASAATPTATLTPTASTTPTATVTMTALPSVTSTPTPAGTALPSTATPTIRSTADNGTGDGVLAYPNPGRSEVWFRLPSGDITHARIRIYNSAGERVASIEEESPPGGKVLWRTDAMPPGIYFYQVKVSQSGSERELEPRKLSLIR